MKNQCRVCLVTTVRDPGVGFEGFLKYHLKIGFEKLYVFFDDPKDPAIKIARKIKGVEAIQCNSEIRRKWKKLRVYNELKKTIHQEVMARQALNANLGMGLAIKEKFDWIFHIDGDELIYNRFKWPIHRIMAQIPKEILQITMLNNEVVPQKSDINNPFTEATLFKKNRRVLNNKASQKRIFKKYFTEMERDYFIAYGHGKSAARVGPDVYPAVHNFKKETTKKELYLFGGPPSAFLPTATIDELILYHYPNCGFNNYLNKYKLLGDFVLPKFNVYDKKSLHVMSRNAYAAKDLIALENLYKRRVQFSDEVGIKRLVTAGIFEKNDFMSKIIKKTQR